MLSIPRFHRKTGLFLALVLGAGGSWLHGQTLVSYYSFDSGTITTSGSSITSVSGSGTAAPTLFPMGSMPNTAAGRFGAAADFSGALGFEANTWGTGATTLGSSFSVSFWMRTSDVTQLSNTYVFQTGADSGSPQNAILFGYAAGKLEFYSTSQNDVRDASGITLAPALNNTWFHVAYTYNGSVLKGYLNGAEVFSATMGINLNAAGGLSIGGARNGAGSVPGLLDDFALWNGALSPAQVASLQSMSVGEMTAVPEPSTYAAMAGAGAMGVALWRRWGVRFHTTGTQVG